MESNFQLKLREELTLLINRTLTQNLTTADIRFDRSPEEVSGDLAFGCFPLAKLARRAPNQIAAQLAAQTDCALLPGVTAVSASGGYLNLTLDLSSWLPDTIDFLLSCEQPEKGSLPPRKVVIEYSSPNTNKPQHLGHVRNNVLGQAVANLLSAAGDEVIRVNLINDRGIHICKSMLTWIKLGEGETPETTGEKGDHLVGRYYVRFETEIKLERKRFFAAAGIDPQQLAADELVKREQDFLAQSSWQQEAEELLLRWEAGDKELLDIWRTMNSWVLAGFDQTYSRYGITFDRTYFESETYLSGRNEIESALQAGLVQRREDGSIWISLAEEELEDKLLQRSNGTSVYITQDVGTALQRYEDYHFDRLIYVVGNEQRYHFRVLIAILRQLGHTWADNLEHLAYGMVNLPEGKLKSREGTAVDADDLLQAVKQAARQVMEASNRRHDFSEQEADQVAEALGLGAIKYYLLRVSANQDLQYDPERSVDLNGTTGPYLQYAYSRMTSLLRKSAFNHQPQMTFELDSAIEKELLLKLLEYAGVVQLAAQQRNPSRLAQYLYELARIFNRFWHDLPVLKAESSDIREQRLALTAACQRILQRGLHLLGIPTPEKI
ncbi:MAG: arginine--tRNA ligase [Candidatus Delongbacteria bacterium]|nr:arginine--tRNA ligase [Candidatus Delongbacteria bacterium]